MAVGVRARKRPEADAEVVEKQTDQSDDDVPPLTFMRLIQLSRPGWWLVNAWLYMAPTGMQWHLFSTAKFWFGLLWVVFPLNLLVYGLNDYTDVEIDVTNPRKGNFVYGAKCSRNELQNLPKVIFVSHTIGTVIFCAWGQSLHFVWIMLAAAAVNVAYNIPPLRLSGRGPFELPTVVAGFSIVTILSTFWNELPWPPTRYWLHMTFLVLRTQLWTEFMDHDEDAGFNRKTTSVLLGRALSQIAVAAVLAGEALMVWVNFDDAVLRGFSVMGLVMFILTEVLNVLPADKDKKIAVHSQNLVGLLLMVWIWNQGLFVEVPY